MWAMMPIFLNLFRSCLAIALLCFVLSPLCLVICSLVFLYKEQITKLEAQSQSLPFVMRKRFVGVRHTVRIFLLLNSVAAIICRVEDFRCETVGHRLLAASSCIR